MFSVGFTGLVLLIMPQIVLGAELTFKVVPNIAVNDNTITVEVRIDPESKKLNVVEGTISFSGTASDNLSVQVENGQSVLPLWPVPPLYIESEKAINFTGGIPGGFDNEGLLFRMRLSSTLYGDLDISYVNGSAYLNDGKGTGESIYSEPLKIRIDLGASSGFTQLMYVMIALLIVAVLFIVYRYAYKRNIKK